MTGRAPHGLTFRWMNPVDQPPREAEARLVPAAPPVDDGLTDAQRITRAIESGFAKFPMPGVAP